MRRKNFVFLVLIISVIGVSCEKSEEFPSGGLVEEADVNLLNSWRLQKYLRNSEDETSVINISNYSEEYTEVDTYSRTYTNIDEEIVSETGNWAFSENSKTLHISNVSSIQDFSEAHSTLSSSTYTIIKLTASEYWYQFENGGDSHEFRFTAQ